MWCSVAIVFGQFTVRHLHCQLFRRDRTLVSLVWILLAVSVILFVWHFDVNLKKKEKTKHYQFINVYILLFQLLPLRQSACLVAWWHSMPWSMANSWANSPACHIREFPRNSILLRRSKHLKQWEILQLCWWEQYWSLTLDSKCQHDRWEWF